ncbi:MAG: TetR/AcrR family transcriptional regulator [Myxococcales bacterium]|nr:TetR/AcrR family transcriptional regulator [Myxococcales bacterium]
MPVRSERRRLAPEERRAQILDAALRCFGEKGYHASRMDDLVRASGLSKGSLYWHFESKEDVFLALFDAFEAELFAAWEEEAEHAASALSLLRREGEIVLERMASQRTLVAAWMEFLIHPAARARLRLTYERTRARLVARLARGVETGELRDDLSLDDIAALFTGALEGLVLQAFVDPAFDARGCFDRTFTVHEKGIAR